MLTLRVSSHFAGALRVQSRQLTIPLHTSSFASKDVKLATDRFSGKIKDQPDADQGIKFTQKEYRQSAGQGVPARGDDYFDKNLKLKRPLSPHISIYQPQLPWLMSITHRVSGVALSLGLSLASVGILLASHDFVHYVDVIRSMHLNPYLIMTVKFGAAWFFTYHYLNGVRHLFWDNGKGFKLPEVYRSGYAVLALSLLTAAYLVSLK
ncbi:hypothetical protein RvY_00384 [Ramazzottius varieornatus]|uniref:Uncharacterized protein n=1 Tax=Ramazzottius varieornatus TaxID=947166 RepID=A0A1D1UCL1_RAMVA|nr:hypothetical protein RvY_00384 [Ramazzottius varieornatus]